MSPSKDTQFSASNQPEQRPSSKGIPNTKTILNELLDLDYEVTEDKDIIESSRTKMFKAQIKKACKGDSLAFSKIMDRVDGKPVQTNVIEDNSNVLNIIRTEDKSGS